MSIGPLRFGRPPGLPDCPFLNWPDLGGRLYPAGSLSLACLLMASATSATGLIVECGLHKAVVLNYLATWLAPPTEGLAPPNAPFFHKKRASLFMKKFC